MDKFKNFIDNNREAFEQENPPEGHELRFQEKLKKRKRSNIRSLMAIGGTIAAAIFLLLMLLHPSSEIFDTEDANNGWELCENSDEMNEMKYYYNTRMNNLIQNMQAVYDQSSVPGLKELIEQSEVIISNTHTFEENVLPELPCSDRSLYILKTHYDSSLNSLLYLEEQMNEITNK